MRRDRKKDRPTADHKKRPERPERPWWVKLGLWGLPDRVVAWAFVWISVGIAVGCIIYGFFEQVFFVGGVFVFGALWYYLAIRWVDRNDSWSRGPRTGGGAT